MEQLPELVSLTEIADLVNRVFKPNPPIQHNTPFVWWDRSTASREVRMALPMPIPDIRIGKKNSPLWRRERIVLWYGEWKAMKEPHT